MEENCEELENKQSELLLSKIPHEVLTEIFKNLDPKSLIQTAYTSSLFSTIIFKKENDKSLWQLHGQRSLLLSPTEQTSCPVNYYDLTKLSFQAEEAFKDYVKQTCPRYDESDFLSLFRDIYGYFLKNNNNSDDPHYTRLIETLVEIKKFLGLDESFTQDLSPENIFKHGEENSKENLYKKMAHPDNLLLESFMLFKEGARRGEKGALYFLGKAFYNNLHENIRNNHEALLDIALKGSFFAQHKVSLQYHGEEREKLIRAFTIWNDIVCVLQGVLPY